MKGISDIWIGLCTVYTIDIRGDIYLSGAKEGFVNVLAQAWGEADYFNKVAQALDQFGIGIKEVEDVELLSERERRCAVDPSLKRLVDDIQKGAQVQFGTFHVY